nr:MAG TPA: hypothetical protein [Caudoviricetes sp.]
MCIQSPYCKSLTEKQEHLGVRICFEKISHFAIKLKRYEKNLFRVNLSL